ncbi:hypothetical protein [Pedobacter frigiditerrae]|nr:hypothetical protein [Pedobacter frigiditerrae]
MLIKLKPLIKQSTMKVSTLSMANRSSINALADAKKISLNNQSI